MIFDSRSSYMLKYEKSKSKLVEFSVAKEDYPNYPLNSDDLTYTTLYALSRYCEELIEAPSSDELIELKKELVIVSQYYDSTVKTQQRKKYSNLFLLLGATAYFLSENFGSAKVLIEQINNWKFKSDISTILYATLISLLTGKRVEVVTAEKDFRQYLGGLESHFENGASPEVVFETLHEIRNRVYQSANISDVNYVDFLFAVTISAIEHSAWMLLPQHSNSTSTQWADYLSKADSVKLLWPAQKVILEAGALTGKDLVVPLPTGVGKTKSIELLLRAKFMDSEDCIAIVIAPLRALCNEITADLTSALGGEVIINQFTDTAQEDFDITIASNTSYVFICTPEKFSYIIRHQPDFLTTIQFFIFDEAHLFDDASRGTQYELLVSEISRSRNENAQMVLFSAVLSNANQISGWLFEDEAATVDYSLVRSTEKSIGFLSSDQTIHYYEKDDMAAESFFVPKSIVVKHLTPLKKGTTQKVFPDKNARDIAIYLANKLCDRGGVAIYAGQVKSIPPTMRRIVEIHNKGYNLSSLLENGNPGEIAKISNLFALHYGKSFELTKASRLGAFPHYADLASGIKMSIEHALRKKHISLVICTTTLAEGVNIPIKYLFLTTFSLGTASVKIRKMQNMVGRTARSGIHTEGSAIITDSSFYDNRTNWKSGGGYRWTDCKKMFDYGHTEACMSTMLSLVSDLFIDYDVSYDAGALTAYLIENYNNPLCFSNLAKTIRAWYKGRIDNDDRYKRYAPGIGDQVKQLEHTIESIENYLCYICNSQLNSEQFFETTETLITQTFAYYLGNEEQKMALRKIFNLIAQKIDSNIAPNNLTYFAKSLYGIDVSSKILDWTNENISALSEYSADQLLNDIIVLFLQLFPDKIKVEFDILMNVLRLWITGEPYASIRDCLNNNLPINKIEKICSNIFSFHICFLIGNILDAIDDRSGYLTEQLTILQKNIKYGVSSAFQIFICENIFDDRIIAKQLDDKFGQTLAPDETFQDCIVANRQEILSILKDYPEYFSHKLRVINRRCTLTHHVHPKMTHPGG